MKWNSIWITMILVLSASCGKKASEIFGAPKTSDRIGVIASCTTKSMAQEVAETINVNYRVINEKKGLIEFIGAQVSELQKHLPKARLKKNLIYNHLVELNSHSAPSKTFTIQNDVLTRSSMSSDFFSHLGQINAINFINNNQGQGATIAIIDTGVSYNHPHLAPNIKVNLNDSIEGLSSSFDDDNNGYVDDYMGWDFYNHDSDPMDDHGHGTHVAGLAAGTVGGVAPKANILPIKVLGSTGNGDLGTISAGILYAIENGADIINLSLGGPDAGSLSSDLQELFNVVEVARKKNVMIVAAAGNGGDDFLGDCNDQYNIYPANIDSSNLLSIASVDYQNELTNYSNFGFKTVHIAAPGGDDYMGGLLSTGIADCEKICNNENAVYYRSMGTSMATPLVAGLIALIKGRNPNMDHKDIRDIILKNGTESQSLYGLIESSKVINVENSLRAL